MGHSAHAGREPPGDDQVRALPAPPPGWGRGAGSAL